MQTVSQVRKPKPGDTHFCAKEIEARLFAATTKRLAAATRKAQKKGKRRASK